MIKKIYSITAIVLASIVLYACTPVETKVQLPVLNGLNQAQVATTLDDLGLKYEIHQELNYNVGEGLFVKYGEGMAAGLSVDPKDTMLVIYISTHVMVLPDLTGLTEDEIKTALKGFRITLTFNYLDTTEFEPGYFIKYDGTFAAGNTVYENTNVHIVISRVPESYSSPIFISKYVSGVNNDKALEIYNALDNEVDLSGYTLDFYQNGSKEITDSIVFSEGTKIAGKDTLLLVNSDANTTLLGLADMTTSKVMFDGNDYIKLSDHNGSFIDEFGLFGVAIMINNNRISVRKSSVFKSSIEYKVEDWDIYHVDYYDILDSHPTEFPADFTFHPEYLDLDFFTQPNGMLKVTYLSNNDGDTARFEELEESVRFYAINTLETNDPDPEIRAKAEAAGLFVQQRLSPAKDIYVQQAPVGGIRETYGRYLALIWYDGKLINYELVLHGHSQHTYEDPAQSVIYKGVTLNEWFNRAQSYARANRLGIWA